MAFQAQFLKCCSNTLVLLKLPYSKYKSTWLKLCLFSLVRSEFSAVYGAFGRDARGSHQISARKTRTQFTCLTQTQDKLRQIFHVPFSHPKPLGWSSERRVAPSSAKALRSGWSLGLPPAFFFPSDEASSGGGGLVAFQQPRLWADLPPPPIEPASKLERLPLAGETNIRHVPIRGNGGPDETQKQLAVIGRGEFWLSLLCLRHTGCEFLSFRVPFRAHTKRLAIRFGFLGEVSSSVFIPLSQVVNV